MVSNNNTYYDKNHLLPLSLLVVGKLRASIITVFCTTSVLLLTITVFRVQQLDVVESLIVAIPPSTTIPTSTSTTTTWTTSSLLRNFAAPRYQQQKQQQQQQQQQQSYDSSLLLSTKSTTTTTTTTTWGRPKSSSSSTFHTSSSSSSSTKSSSSTRIHLRKNPWNEHDSDLLHRKYRPKYVQNKTYDYVIVGSGIGGLWLSACLAKFNKTSLVLEQHTIVGGFQHTFTIQGYEFVPGLHYIANLQLCLPLYEMVAAPTIPPLTFHQSGKAVVADTIGQSHTLQVGSLPTMYVKEGIQNVRDELVRVFPKEQHAIQQFIHLMEQAKWQAGQFATFKIFPPFLTWLFSNLLCSHYIKYASLTTEQVLNPLTDDGRLATVLSAFGGDLGESLADGSFVMQAAVLGHVVEGCYYPQGGPIQFVRGLVPTIRSIGGDVLVSARVQQIVLDELTQSKAIGVQLVNGDIITAQKGVVSDAGIPATLQHLLPPEAVNKPSFAKLRKAVEECSGGISHVFAFVGLNASTEDLQLQSSSFYYIPWNETNKNMDATAIQEHYRNTLLDPNVLDVSAGMVFCTAKDPVYSSITMPGRSTVIVFSEARAHDFDIFLEVTSTGKNIRTKEYKDAKQLIERKMIRSLLLNFPQLEPHIDVVEIGTPLTIFDYTLRTDTLGLRHTPQRMTNFDIRPDCPIDGLYFTGQDIAFAGWAGALTGAMVAAQRILGYTLFDFVRGKTLMRDLGRGDVEDMIQRKVKDATKASPIEIIAEIFGNLMKQFA